MRTARGLRLRLPRVGLPAACACLLLLAAPVRAQHPPSGETVAEAPKTPRARRHPRLVYFGMWTTHLKEDEIVLDNNWVIGMSARGFFGATFMNSYGRRAFTGGIQRTVISTAPRTFGASVGYRLGFVTGYDGRLMRLARKTPVMPLVQPFASIEVRRVGVEVSYTFVVVSAALSYRF